MEERRLTVQKRAFPSKGRARVHASVLSDLGVDERGTLDIWTTAQDRWITVSGYGDSMVQPDSIRLSEEDLRELGVENGDEVVVKKARPLSDQVKDSAQAAADHVATGFEDIKGRITKSVEPVATKAHSAAQDAYNRVSKDLPTRDDINKALDAAKKKLAPNVTPDEAGTLISLLYENKGAIRSILIPAGSGEHTIPSLVLPEGIIILAIRRDRDELLIPKNDSTVAAGDRVYLMGNEELLAAAIEKLGV
ncbi:MAG: TrkA C-terminal domain-containing protein [Methanoregula sp.]|jgi:hypothetical protein